MAEIEMAGYGPCSDSKDSEFHAKKRQTKWSCTSVTAGCSCMLSLVTSVFIVFLTIQVTTLSRNLLIETRPRQNESYHRSNTAQFEFLKDDLNSVSGTFMIDQEILKRTKTVRWMGDITSSVGPVSNLPCLTIPVSGKYLIVSRFTYNILKTTDTSGTSHYLKLNTQDGQFKEHSFRRKLLSFPQGKDETIGSVFIEFYDITANEQLCANTSNPELLYLSSLDNDINIIKL